MSFAIPLHRHTLFTDVPYRITIGGVVYERVMIDGAFVEIDGNPLYMEI